MASNNQKLEDLPIHLRGCLTIAGEVTSPTRCVVSEAQLMVLRAEESIYLSPQN